MVGWVDLIPIKILIIKIDSTIFQIDKYMTIVDLYLHHSINPQYINVMLTSLIILLFRKIMIMMSRLGKKEKEGFWELAINRSKS